VANDIVFIDENCLIECVDPALMPDYIHELTNVLLELQSCNNESYMTSHYTNIELGYRGVFLYNILFAERCELNLPTEIIRQLNVLLDRCIIPDCTATQHVKLQTATNLNAESSAVYSEAYDMSRRNKDFVGILHRVKGEGRGPANLIAGSNRVGCFLVSEKNDLESFFRKSISVLQPDDSYFISLCKKAFPKLEMHPSIRLANLGLDVKIFSKAVVEHLSFLNDHLVVIGTKCNWDMPTMMQMASAMNVDLSDESSNTKKVEKKMRERDCTFIAESGPVTVRCSYHTKIVYNRGRIHFFPSHKDFPEKVIVGIFDPHLTI
jgi:hypothetical protein